MFNSCSLLCSPFGEQSSKLSGTFKPSEQAHGNAQFIEAAYRKTQRGVEDVGKEMVKTKKPIQVYENMLTAGNARPRNLKQTRKVCSLPC